MIDPPIKQREQRTCQRMRMCFQINQAFSRIYTVAASVSIALWSISALRHGGLSRGIAIYGCIIAPVLILAICTGHLTLNVHGMAIVVFAQAIWFITVGIQFGSDHPITTAA